MRLFGCSCDAAAAGGKRNPQRNLAAPHRRRMAYVCPDGADRVGTLVYVCPWAASTVRFARATLTQILTPVLSGLACDTDTRRTMDAYRTDAANPAMRATFVRSSVFHVFSGATTGPVAISGWIDWFIGCIDFNWPRGRW